MQKITEYLKDKYGPWGWMGQRAHDACGINQVLPLDFIISCNYGTETPYYFPNGRVFSLEKKNNIRKDWSNEDLNESLKGSLGREIFAYLASFKKSANILCYRSVRKLENRKAQASARPLVYAMPERLKRFFDNKILLHRNLPKLSIPAIEGKIAKLAEETFAGLRRELSLPFVIQFPYGSSGNFTFKIEEEKEYNRLRRKYPHQMVTIRKYINGFAMNANAVIITSEKGPVVHCAFPSVQMTGIPECSNSPTSFCGNDYTSACSLDKETLEGVYKNMKAIGLWMASFGFRGIFGMDFVVKDGIVYPVEINPRFQNSTSLFTSLEGGRSSRSKAFFLLHIAEFLQKKDKMMKKYIKEFPFDSLKRPLKGSQIILHNRLKQKLVTGEILPGIYRKEGRKFLIKKRTASITDCKGEDILITCGVPGLFTPVEANAPICKIQSLKEALGTTRRKLTPGAAKAVSMVYEKLKLKEAKKVEMAGVR
jgi:predicted ATP-grasp superfamily ATP-dependent carboligase